MKTDIDLDQLPEIKALMVIADTLRRAALAAEDEFQKALQAERERLFSGFYEENQADDQ